MGGILPPIRWVAFAIKDDELPHVLHVLLLGDVVEMLAPNHLAHGFQERGRLSDRRIYGCTHIDLLYDLDGRRRFGLGQDGEFGTYAESAQY